MKLLASLLLIGAVAAAPSELSAQCAKCGGPQADPCLWGPFAGGGASSCTGLIFIYGCNLSGDCNESGGGGELPGGGDPPMLAFAADGVGYADDDYTASREWLSEDRTYEVKRSCRGVIVAVHPRSKPDNAIGRRSLITRAGGDFEALIIEI